MNNKLFYLFAILACLTASCAKNEVTEPTPAMARVSASLDNGATESRVALEKTYNATDAYGLKVTWLAGDRLSVICWQGDDSDWHAGLSDEQFVTLTTEQITNDGRTANFTFPIPANLDKNQPMKVLITYLNDANCTTYFGKNNTEKDFPTYDINQKTLRLVHASTGVLSIENRPTLPRLTYVSNRMPMTLLGTIAANWDENPVLDTGGNTVFEHTCVLFAVQLNNKKSSPITPDKILVNVGSYLFYRTWNPITKSASTDFNYTSVIINSEESIQPGESRVYYLPYFTSGGNANVVCTIFGDNIVGNTSTPEPGKKFTIERGKCYSLDINVLDSYLEWSKTHTETEP